MKYRIIFFGLALISVVLNSCTENKKSISKNTKPNLLIIQTDEHNFRTLGCYRELLPPEQAYIWGEGIAVETPHIDMLAHQGALCTSFYATTPVCSPSRASFMSGLYPQNTPVITNDIPLSDEVVTFAKVLQDNGYATGYAGKWHLDGVGKPQWAPKRNFGFEDNRYMFNRGHWKQLEDSETGPQVAARDSLNEPSYSIKGADEKNFTTDFIADKAIEFINIKKDRPFCYMISLPDPHGPNSVRPPYDTMYNHLDFQKPKTAGKSKEGLPTWAKMSPKTISQQGMAKYFGMVKCIDDNVGKIIDELEQNGLMENTIIIFTSDHGDLCGEHGRDNKGVPFETSARIPFLLYYPNMVKAKTIINEAMTTVDFMPTILGLMNVKSAGNQQGRDASDLFVNNHQVSTWEDVAFIRGTGQRTAGSDVNWLGAVTDRYKLIYSPKDDPWLIDLESDPDELINFYQNSNYKDVVKKLSKAIIKYGEGNNDPRIHMNKIRSELDIAIQ